MRECCAIAKVETFKLLIFAKKKLKTLAKLKWLIFLWDLNLRLINREAYCSLYYKPDKFIHLRVIELEFFSIFCNRVYIIALTSTIMLVLLLPKMAHSLLFYTAINTIGPTAMTIHSYYNYSLPSHCITSVDYYNNMSLTVPVLSQFNNIL